MNPIIQLKSVLIISKLETKYFRSLENQVTDIANKVSLMCYFLYYNLSKLKQLDVHLQIKIKLRRTFDFKEVHSNIYSHFYTYQHIYSSISICSIETELIIKNSFFFGFWNLEISETLVILISLPYNMCHMVWHMVIYSQ